MIYCTTLEIWSLFPLNYLKISYLVLKPYIYSPVLEAVWQNYLGTYLYRSIPLLTLVIAAYFNHLTWTIFSWLWHLHLPPVLIHFPWLFQQPAFCISSRLHLLQNANFTTLTVMILLIIYLFCVPRCPIWALWGVPTFHKPTWYSYSGSCSTGCLLYLIDLILKQPIILLPASLFYWFYPLPCDLHGRVAIDISLKVSLSLQIRM